MHRARVRLPLPVSQVLRCEPCLISLAVEGFYDRDVDSMKYALKMERFLKSPGGGVDLVAASVRMSRAMYGQLVQQRFKAPRCYPMPGKEEGSVVFAEAELGMKTSCGFEMMYQARKKMGEEGKGGAWAAFMESLESSGYFGDLLPGSEEYKRLMREAEDSYKSSDLFSRTRDLKEVDLDVDRFMECFKLTGKSINGQHAEIDSDLEEKSSYSDMDFGEDSDSDHQSDKDSPQHTFMNSYSNALNEELKATALEKSFLYAHQDIASNSKGTSTDAEDIYEGLATVNVDGNLVMSLLDSFVSQQGLPGPTSNFLGSLGLSIPREKKRGGT